MYDKNIESKVAESILQQIKEITIGDEVISVAPPSTATIILASKEIAKLPHIELEGKNIVLEALCIANDCCALGDIVAILALGAKGLTKIVKIPEIIEKTIERTVYNEYLFGLIKRPKVITETITETIEKEAVVDCKAELAKKLLEDIPPRELHGLASRLFSSLQISDFFGLTTSLIEINLLRQTRGVVKETTASGQS